ncbi:MAG: alpha/beta hydrolase [bacterium]
MPAISDLDAGLAGGVVVGKTSCAPARAFALVAAAVAALIANSPDSYAATSAHAAFGAAWQSVDCKTFDVPDTVAVMSDCGYVTVPEQHSLQDGRTIELAVVRIRSTGETPADDPLFVEQGGPGDSTIGVIVNQLFPHLPGLKAVLETRDLVFVEERGTRYSKPFLTCPEYDAKNIAVAKGEMAYSDPSWFRTCQARFQKQGVRLGAFNTVENAADVYFVAEILGYRAFNYYGVSYGTLLGQYVIAQADQHKAKLRSVIIDGVVRADIDFNLASSHSISFALRNVFHACAQDQQCSWAYPDLEQKFLTVIDRLDRQPVSLTLTTPRTNQPVVTKLDGITFVTALEPLLARPYSGNSARGTSIPKFITAASEGNFDWAVDSLSGDLESSDGSAKGMYHTVVCVREKSMQTPPDEALPLPFPQLRALGEREADAVAKVCSVLEADRKPAFAYRNPDVPTLVLNGGYDPVTPQPYGEAVAAKLKNAYVYTFPGIGHGSFFPAAGMPATDCSITIAIEFLTNPGQAPDSSCLARVKPLFVVE